MLLRTQALFRAPKESCRSNKAGQCLGAGVQDGIVENQVSFFVEYVAMGIRRHGIVYVNMLGMSRCQSHLQVFINGGVRRIWQHGVKHTISTIPSRMRGRRMAGPEAERQYVARCTHFRPKDVGGAVVRK